MKWSSSTMVKATPVDIDGRGGMVTIGKRPPPLHIEDDLTGTTTILPAPGHRRVAATVRVRTDWAGVMMPAKQRGLPRPQPGRLRIEMDPPRFEQGWRANFTCDDCGMRINNVVVTTAKPKPPGWARVTTITHGSNTEEHYCPRCAKGAMAAI